MKPRFKKILLCLLLAAAASLPLLNGSLPYGNDTTFHMNRIEALTYAIYNRDFFPRIFWFQNYNFGYGSPLFYSIVFLYFPAALRILHVPMIMTYRIFLFVIFFCTAYAMYSLIETVLGKQPVLCFTGSMFYLFCTYIYQNTYNRGAVGEALAYIFIPLILLGLYHLFVLHSGKWHILTLALTGLLLSHNISFFLIVLLIVVYCLIHVREIFRDRNLLMELFLAVFTAFLLTCWFSLPMLEQLSSHLYRVSNYFFNGQTLHEQSVRIRDLFNLLPYDYDHLTVTNIGVFVLFLPALSFLFRDDHRFIHEMTNLGYILLLMSTFLFPWQYFSAMSFIQFPQRFLIICAAPLTLSAVFVLKNLLSGHKNLVYGITAVQCLLCLMMIWVQYDYFGLFMDYTQPEMIADTGYYYPEDDSWYNIMQVSSPDYLIADTKIHFRHQTHDILFENSSLSEYESVYNHIRFNAQESGTCILPKTYYKGYSARNMETRELKEVTPDPVTGLVKIELREDEKNCMIDVSYTGTRLQTITQYISLLTWAEFLIYLCRYYFRARPQ